MAEPISIQDVKNIDKEIKKLKMQRKNMGKTKSNKIEDEKSEVIKIMTLFYSVLRALIPIGTIFFLVGGVLYTNILLSIFDINASDFFDISDYISSSADVILPMVISVAVVFFVGISRAGFNAMTTKQSNVKIRSYMSLVQVIAIISGVLFVYGLIDLDIFLPIPLLISSLFFLKYIRFGFTKTEKYKERGLTFRVVVFSVFIFIVLLGIETYETRHEVKTGSYQNPYIISFQEEYEKYSDHAFFLANSNYFFLLNKKAKEVVVIPKTGIKAIQSKKNDETDSLIRDVFYQRWY